MFNFRRMSNPISAEQSVCFVLIDFNGATHRPVKSCMLCVTLSQLLPPRSPLQHGLWSESLQNARASLALRPHEPYDLVLPHCVLVAVSGMWENGLGVTGNHVIYSEHSQTNTNLIFIIQLVESCSSTLLSQALSS